MGTDIKQQAIDDLTRRKKSFRRYLYGLSPTEKIRHLEMLQRRYYAILEAREQSGGRPVPERWKKWHTAQQASK